MGTCRITLNVNGQDHKVEVQPYHSLLKVLRNQLAHSDVRRACDYGGCGACTVIMNGKAIYSCMMPAIRAEGKDILTLEGLSKDGQLDSLQVAFMRTGAIQCGYCTSGMIMSARALLDQNPDPTEDEIREALTGNLCRCTGYAKIIEAIREAAATQRTAR